MNFAVQTQDGQWERMQEKMQEKAKTKREGLTAKLQAKDASASKRKLLWLAKELTWAGIAYLVGLGSMLFETKPLGVALICATGGHLIGILGGLIAAEIMLRQNMILMISTYAAATLIRAVSSLLLETPDAKVPFPARLRDQLPRESAGTNGQEPRTGNSGRGKMRTALRVLRMDLRDLFGESVRLRMATAAVSMLVVSLFRVISGGFRYYDLFAMIFAVVVSPAATLVFSVRLGNKKEKSTAFAAISSGAFIYALVWSADFAAIANIRLSPVLALFLTLLVCERNGIGWGAAAGILCGIAYQPMQAPAFLLGALVYGGMRRVEKENAGILLACFSALVWSVYTAGISTLTMLLPAYLLSGTAFSVTLLFLRKYTQEPEGSAEPLPDPETELRCARVRHEDANDRLRNISEAFVSLSEMFYNLSDRLRRPGTLDLRRICDGSFDAYCADCPNKTVCWGLEYSETLAIVSTLISDLHTKGRVTKNRVPVHLRQRCHAMEQILQQINAECARFTGELLRNNRTEIFAMDYEAAANIINDALEEDNGEYRFDPELESRISDYLSDANISSLSVSVYGMRRRQILIRGVNIERSTVTMETLRCDLGEMCGLELSTPAFEVEGNVTSMILQARRKLSVTGAQHNLSADGGVSGDTVNLFSNKKDFFYALISDGMGAGREAALTSNLCSTFLEKMLRAGNRAGTSLRMLNNMILSRCADSTGECSSTIDLIELDLITGEASFIKGGAAPSFVIRGGTVHRLHAGTAPIGIIRTLDTQTSGFEFRPGDTVVMVSDGILQDDPECQWLVGFLTGCGGSEPDEIVHEICRHASSFPHHDDCSAIALRIRDAEPPTDTEDTEKKEVTESEETPGSSECAGSVE